MYRAYKSLEQFCAALRADGVDARLLPLDDPKKDIVRIHIEKSPICRATVRLFAGEEFDLVIQYEVPEERPLPKLSLESVPVKSSPIFGRVINIKWRIFEAASDSDKAAGVSLAQSLANDEEIKTTIINMQAAIKGRSFFGLGYPMISTDWRPNYWSMGPDRLEIPFIGNLSKGTFKYLVQRFQYYERIATRLLVIHLPKI